MINEFLPVKELAGRPIKVSVLRQFGLVENEKLDRLLNIAFGKPQEPDQGSAGEAKKMRIGGKAKTAQARK